jgi:hypothetical protein
MGPPSRKGTLAVVFALLLSACANQKPTRSGFLNQYEDLQPRDGGGRILSTARAADLQRFSTFVLGPVALQVMDEGVDRTALDQVAKALREAVREQLAKERREVAEPSGDTLGIKLAITAVTRSRPVLNVAMTLVGPPLFNGGLSIEAEAIDARSGARVAAMAWADEGRINPIGYYTEYGHPRALTRDFARDFGQLLASLPGGS